MSIALLKNLSESCTLALWKIEESVESLKQLACLDNFTMKAVEDFHIDKRKKEWLCIRILIKEIFGKYVLIKYNENGKPYINYETYSISISHSGDYAGVIVSKNGKVGIDIENISPRIEKIKEKFLSINELKSIPSGENYQKQLLLYWCAKEAMMKICGKKGIDFKKQLKINPFIYTSNGLVSGEIIEKNKLMKIDINFFEFDNNIVVWGCES